MIDRHWHWQFVAYDGENLAEKIKWGVTVDVIGYLSEADARVAAQDIVARQHHTLIKVYECATCGYRQQNAEIMKEMVDKL